MTNPFLRTRAAADAAADTVQDRNRLWWEGLPMTYADWAGDDRIPETEEDFRRIEAYVLAEAPWLAGWFAGARLDGLDCLDLGCGSGVFSGMLHRRGARVTSMDLTEAGVAMTRRTAGVFGADLAVVRADAEAAPFRDAAFDFVFSWGVLHHTADMDRAMAEMGRILKPGGRGLMMVYHRRSVVYYLHGLFWLVFRGKLFAGHGFESVQDFYTDGFYHRYLTRGELGAKLAESGLAATDFDIVQYRKKILPAIPAALDRYLKARFGMCVVARFAKPEPGAADGR